MNRRALSVCTIVCGYAPNDYAPSRILGACWVQSVLVSIFLGRGTCLWQSCHFWHRERRLHHASQLCTTVFLKCTTISVNAPSFLPKCTTKMRNAPSFFWNAPRQTGKCNLVFSFYQNSRTKPKNPWNLNGFKGFSFGRIPVFCPFPTLDSSIVFSESVTMGKNRNGLQFK